MERRKKTGIFVIVAVVLLAGAAGVWLVTSRPEVSEQSAVQPEKPEEVEKVTRTEREKLPKPGEDGEKEQEDKGADEAEEEAAKIDVELVKTISLPEGTKDVMLDPETLNPKVLIGETYVKFVDEDLSVKNSVVMKEHEGFYYESSVQGKYLGIYIGSKEYDDRR